MTRVLVFPAGSEIGLEIHRSLTDIRGVELVGVSSVGDHAEHVFDEYVGGIPFVDQPEFPAVIERLAHELRIDAIFPAHDSVVLALAEAAATGAVTVPVVTSPVETCRVARSKAATYATLAGVVPVPVQWDSPAAVPEFPVFMKPDVGQGSRGTLVATDRAMAEQALRTDPTLLMMELLPGDEYTVDCFADRYGVLRYAGARVRSRVSNGISVASTTVDDSRFQELASTIHGAIPFRGAWFFQVKEDRSGALTLLEVAPRVAGTMGLARARGINLPHLALLDALGVDVRVIAGTWSASTDRALGSCFEVDIEMERLYLDLDDVLIREGRVDPATVALVVQARNDGAEVHLVTRHAGDLAATLRSHRLEALFDEVHHLTDDEPKSSAIKDGASVFVDDSFRERAEVHDTLGIPVFDASGIEVLLHRSRRNHVRPEA